MADLSTYVGPPERQHETPRLAKGVSRADDVCCPECGCIFAGTKKRRPRSVPQHRRFFGLVKAAFGHWPHAYPFQPRDAEHLRAWLLMQAGHCEVAQTIRCEEADPVRLTAVLRASFAAARSHAFVEVDDNVVRVVVPHSTSFDKLPHSAACVILTVVDKIIEAVIGVPADQLLRERAA